MSGWGVPDSDMPNFTRRARREAPAIPDAALSQLLAGGTAAADASAPLQHVADVLAALRAAPARGEAAGQAAALAQFRQQAGVSSVPLRPRRRRPTLLSPLLSAKAAAAAAVAVVGLGGVATAAFAGALPSSAQQLAHNTIGAPSPRPASTHTRPDASHSATPAGPSATGPAAFGLCTAYTHATQHGTAAQKAVAFRNLEKAAGGAANVAHFCASIPHPGTSATPQNMATSHPTGAPSHPTGAPASHPAGMPSPHPTGDPSPHPAGPPTNS